MEGDVPSFPCWGLKLDDIEKNNSEIVKRFLEIRENNRWLLISKNVAASDRHLWSTWYLMEENFLNDSALSKNPDAEFIRIISGTNQLKTAFKRAGLNDSDKEAWLLFLPEKNQGLDNLPEIQIKKLTKYSEKIINELNLEKTSEKPIPCKLGLDRLGIIYDGEEDLINENIFISHLAKSTLST